HTGNPFAAWLYRIAVNTITDRQRSFRFTLPIEAAGGCSRGPSTEDLAIQRAEIQRIWMLAKALPREQRIALQLKFQGDLSFNDIALVMHKTPGAAKLLIHRALKRLRLELAVSVQSETNFETTPELSVRPA
ncbi:MAG: sigma-70 family RNA polymerase sigma factor, partial [Candidatus Dormibacteraeota bacterium]|nr:sigma-70 family RNA polymerase sigma factor [Candidatus Dormibacteraeota bacterium]